MLACWWVGLVLDMAGWGFLGVSKLMLAHWWVGLDPRVAGLGIQGASELVPTGGQSLGPGCPDISASSLGWVPDSLTAGSQESWSWCHPLLGRAGSWGHWLRVPWCCRAGWPADGQGWGWGIPGLVPASCFVGWILTKQAVGLQWSLGWCLPTGWWGQGPGASTDPMICRARSCLWLQGLEVPELVLSHSWVGLNPGITGYRALGVFELVLAC